MDKALMLFMCIGFIPVIQSRTYEQIQSGDVSLMYTSSNYTYENFYLEVLERNYIVFKVKACSDAHIALLDHKDEGVNQIEIVLGGWTNTLSKIRYMLQGETLAEAYTYDLLHCGEFRTFWVHWSSHIAVGRGAKYYEQELMSTPRDQHRFDINFAAMSTGFGHTGVWEITQGYAYHSFLYTPNIFPEAFQYMSRSVQKAYGFFTFHARACHDLHIAMGAMNHQWKYRVNICGWTNTRTCVVENGVFNCANTTDVCDCEKFKPFWISWKDNIIRIGKGDRIHSGLLHEYTPSRWTDISYLSFSTGWGSDGIWMFNEDLENSWAITGLETASESTVYDNWLGTSKSHFIHFGVEACGDVTLVMSSELGQSEDSYLIFLAKGNATSGVAKGSIDNELHSVSTPELLKCNAVLPFWMSFNDKIIKLGEGYNYGWRELFNFEVEDETFDIYSIGLGTNGPNVVWHVKKNSVDMIYSQTQPGYRARNVWMTVRQDFVSYVNILGKKDAVIFLSETPGYPDDYGYEIIIGYDTTKMLLRQKRGDAYSIIRETDVGEVLSETEWRMFWVSWKDGYIKCGSGWKYDKKILIESALYVPHVINGLGITALSDDVLQWEFEAEQGDFFSMRTDTHDASREFGYRWAHVYTPDDGYWLYFQVSGGAACLCLSQVYGNAEGSYVIHIGSEENTKVQMWTWGGSKVDEETEVGVIHQDQMRVFWVSWYSGQIQFGKGRYRGRSVLLSHNDGGFGNVHAIGMGGLDNHFANWRFSERQGLIELSYQTNDLEDNQQLWLSLTRKTEMVFAVKACKEVHLWFGAIMYSESWYDSYLIVLQNGTDYSYISTPWRNGQGMNRKIDVQVYSPNLLSCDSERVFWVSWLKKELIIGTGGNIGENILMSIHHFDSVPIRAFSVHTYSNTGKIRIPVSSHAFAEARNDVSSPDNSLSGGEVFAAVLGFIILTTLFVGAIYIIIRPPAAFKKYLSPPASQGSTSGHIQNDPVISNFENPLHRTSDNEQGY